MYMFSYVNSKTFLVTINGSYFFSSQKSILPYDMYLILLTWLNVRNFIYLVFLLEVTLIVQHFPKHIIW